MEPADSCDQRAWLDVARVAAHGVREGTLTFQNVIGISDADMNSVAQHAESLRRRGRYADACSIYSLLLLYNPFDAKSWRRMADLRQRVGDHSVAVACYETAALLGGRHASSTECEVRSLEAIGQPQLGVELREIAQLQIAAERSAP
jgi:tetratricopeptide (TPR) repeat protein